MSQTSYDATDERNWWERLLESLGARREEGMDYQLPSDSLFASSWNKEVTCVADVPEKIRAQIREEAVLDTFNRLEASLRLLLYATAPDREPPSARSEERRVGKECRSR